MDQQVDNNNLQLVLLPGVGADHRQWQPQKQAFPGLVVPQWIPPLPGDSLPMYSRRFGEVLPDFGPMVLGGSSFGGMVAMEMARIVRPKAVILIGSCWSRKSINRAVLFLRPVLRHIPRWGIKVSQPLAPLGVRTFRNLSPEHRHLCATMFKEANPEFIRWAISAILAWEPTPPTDIPVFHIHGGRDRMIRAAKVLCGCRLARRRSLAQSLPCAPSKRFHK